MARLTHVALFTFKPGTTEEQVAELSAGLATLPGLIPEIKGYRFGPDAGLAEGNVDYGVVAEFDSAEGYRAYAAHAAHRDVIDRLIKPIRDQRTGVQFFAFGSGASSAS